MNESDVEKLDKIIADLGANYREKDEEVLYEILEDISSIASDISNRKKDDEELFPYIKKAVKAEYNTRGAEGLLSRSEGSISSQYEDIIEKMRNNIIKNGKRRFK